MKKIFLLGIATLSFTACKTKQTVDVDTLPKDVSQKPERATERQLDSDVLQKLRNEIDGIIAAVPCSDPVQWRISPIGSKPCGGPAAYIAYPIKIENEILPKISRYTQLASEYNKKYKLISDCAITVPPSEIHCEKGRAVLIKDEGNIAQ